MKKKLHHKLNIELVFQLLFGATLIMHLLLVINIFMPLDTCLNSPLLKYDHAFHYTNTFNLSDTLIHQNKLWSYNPSLGGGIIEVISPSGRLALIANFFAIFTPKHIAYNLYVFLTLILLPLLTLLAAKFFQLPKNSSKGVVILTLCLLWGSDLGREFIYVGHLGFLFSIILAFNTASSLWRYQKCPNKLNLSYHFIFLTLCMWSHNFSLVVLPPLYLATWLASDKTLRKKQISPLLCVILLASSFQLIWVWRFFKYLLFHHVSGTMGYFLQSFPFNYTQFIVNAPIVIIALAALCFFIRAKNLPFIPWRKSFLFVALLLMFISLLGSPLGLSDLQPIRFLIPASIVFIFYLATFNLSATLKINLLAILAATVSYALDTRAYELGCNLQDVRSNRLMTYLKDNISPSSRLHIQASLNLPYFQSRMLALIPAQTKIPILADSFPLPYTFQQFVDNKIFGKSLDQINPDYLMQILNTYNVGYLLVHSASAKEFFDKRPEFVTNYRDDNLIIYKNITLKENFCYQCQADIFIKKRRIIVHNAKNTITTLKFHYHPSLRTSPFALKVYPVQVPGIPLPFIQINNGNIHDFEIYGN